MGATLQQNYEWYLSANVEEYLGKWIAVVDLQIVASGESLKDIYAKVRKEYPGQKPLFEFVDRKKLQMLL